MVFSAAAQTGTPELPEWDSAGESSHWYPRGGLWPEGALPEGALAYFKAKSVRKTRPVPTEYIVLKEETNPVQDLGNLEAQDDLPPIGSKLQNQFFGQRPTRYLIDPQHIITEQKANDVLRFLEIHAEDSRFAIYPVVLGRNQTVPEDVDLPQLHKDWFGGEPTLLFAYQVRVPDSLRIIYNDDVAVKIPKAVLAKIRDHCVSEAKLADNGADQLEKIVIEMSIQAFWLEKLMDRAPSEPEVTVVPEEVTAIPKISEEIRPRVVAEIEPVAVEKPAVSPYRDQIDAVVTPGLIRALIIGSSAILFLAMILFLKTFVSRRKNNGPEPVLFPGYHRQERLGGEFSGGTFVGLSYDPARSGS